MFTSLKRGLAVISISGVCLMLSPVIAQASLTCLSVSGKVRQDFDPSCNVTVVYPGPTYLSQLGVPNTCLSVQLSFLGILTKGSAGLTTETAISPLSGPGQTPAILNEAGIPATPNEFGLPETRRFFTARSALSLPRGMVFTADAGVFNKGYVTEQIVITGGTGLYKNASGFFNVTGNVGQWGTYTGQVCYPL